MAHTGWPARSIVWIGICAQGSLPRRTRVVLVITIEHRSHLHEVRGRQVNHAIHHNSWPHPLYCMYCTRQDLSQEQTDAAKRVIEARDRRCTQFSLASIQSAPKRTGELLTGRIWELNPWELTPVGAQRDVGRNMPQWPTVHNEQTARPIIANRAFILRTGMTCWYIG